MSVIAPTILLTGRRGEHRHSFAQMGELCYIVNGHDSNYIFNTRTGEAHALGIVPPDAPTNGFVAGTLAGTYLYRTRWVDALTGTYSLPSAALSVTVTKNAIRITVHGTVPARATHWLLERTTNLGESFYPLNVDATHPWGTPVATPTFDDAGVVTDETLGNRDPIDENQGAPIPCKWVAVNGQVCFMGGGRIHRPIVSMTNGSTAVSSTDGGFTQAMLDEDFAIPTDADGKSYQIATVTDANNLVLASAYSGATATKEAVIAGKRNRVFFSEPGEGEHFGALVVGGLANEVLVGDDGEAILGGVGLGPAGFLYAGENRLYVHAYDVHPSALQGGRIIPILTRRGICGTRALAFVEGLVYGMDVRGIWVMASGGAPREIGGRLTGEWQTGALNWSAADAFHIGYDAFLRQVFFFVCENSDTLPRKAYVWSLDKQDWVDTKTFPLGVACNLQLPDLSGNYRMNYFQEAAGGAQSYCYCHGIGDSLGAPPTAKLTGTVTSGSATTLEDSAAAWPTDEPKLQGLTVVKRTAAGVEEGRIISDNTATVITVGEVFSDAPAAGDTYRIGELPFLWRSGRIFCGETTKKKVFRELVVWLTNDAAAKHLFCRIYFDGSETAYNDFAARSEDGITTRQGQPDIELDPSVAGMVRFRIPLNGKPATDIQFELYQNEPGTPAEILAVDLLFEAEARERGDIV